MIRQFNRGPLGEAIARFFDMQGETKPDYNETIGSFLKLADLDDSPFLRFAIPVGRYGEQAAVAAQFSAVGIRAAATVALQINQLVIANEDAAAQAYTIALVTPAQVTSVAFAKQANVIDLSTNGVLPRPSEIVITTNATITGGAIGRITIPTGQTVVVNLPKPGIILRGDDPDGRGALAVWHRTLNKQLSVSYYGREWPLG